MNCRIIMDSGGEFTELMRNNEVFQLAPLSIDIDGVVYVDESISQLELLGHIADSPNCPKSSCPSPESYMELYKCDAQNIYVVNISGSLSGSYNSAILGKNLYEEEDTSKNIHIFDTISASVGQTNVCQMIYDMEEAGKDFKEIVETVESFIETQDIYFVLESLEALRKNGRLTGIKSVLATALNIKPVMSANNEGEIIQISQARGIKKALSTMIDYMIENVENPEERVLGIAHCNNRERAEYVKSLVEAKIKLKDIYITDTSGISTLYASEGGIIIAL